MPWLTELPFTFPWTKNDSFAEFVELAAPSGPVRLKPPDVAKPNWVVFEKLDRSDPATAAGTETGGVGAASVACAGAKDGRAAREQFTVFQRFAAKCESCDSTRRVAT